MTERKFASISELVICIEGMFDCENGHYGSSHPVEVSTGVIEHPYITLAAMASVELPDAAGQLRTLLYDAFSILRGSCTSNKPKLYWRYASAERIQEDTGLSKRCGASVKIRTRVVIPDIEFESVNRIVHVDGTDVFWLKEGSWPFKTAV